MAAKRLFRRIHKWLALVAGLQILAWTTGGFVMSFFDIEKVRGEHNIRPVSPAPLTSAAEIVPVHVLLDRVGSDKAVAEIRLKRWLSDRLVYELMFGDETRALIDAQTGERLSPISKEAALMLAQRDFSGAGEPVSAELLHNSNSEYRKELPVWFVTFSDPEDTHIYVSRQTGDILARRNKTWRLYDFFWMLHIMDYENRTDFNHPLLVVASTVAVTVALTGLFLLFKTFSNRDIRYLKRLTYKREIHD